MRQTLFVIGMIAAVTALTLVVAEAADHVSFGTNWLAESEHGGFYQAVVDGTYAKYGLEVTIIQGGPQSNNQFLLPAGKIDFYMGGSMIPAFSAVDQDVPIQVVAGFFQKDPQEIISHPGVGLDHFQDLTKANMFIGKEGLVSFYRWLKSRYSFSDDKVKPYTFNIAPFLADKMATQQGYITSTPYEVKEQGGFNPNEFMLADYGYSTYAATIETRRELITGRPDLVQRFVDASIVGWYHYLYGDHAAADAAIKRDNPDETEVEMAFTASRLRDIVDSGDARRLGIGAMTDSRQEDFFAKMVKAGVVDANIDYKRAYTLQFVNKKVGLDLEPK